MMFESGVRYYTTGSVTLTVAFPEDQICCRYCPWCRAEKEVGRHWCRLTNEMLYNINFRGDGCPVAVEGMEKK